jgi:hypothetical protein
MKGNTLNKLSFVGDFKVHHLAKYIIVCLLLVIFSCKARKPLIVKRVTIDSIAKPADTRFLKLDAIRLAQTNFTTFSSKARTKLDINGDKNDVTLNIRIKRNQKIWVSITAIAGIEVARALITPDSIMLINRLQSLYVRKPFSYVYAFAGKQVSFTTLESLLVGNTIPELVNDETGIQLINGNTELTGTLKELAYKLILGPDLRATQTNLNNRAEGQSLTVINGVFIQAANRIVPTEIDMASVVKDKKVNVNLHYVKVDFNQVLDYPFSIPSRYSPAN